VSPTEGFARLARERGIERELTEYDEQLEQVLPNVRRLVEASRAHRLPLVFTRLVAPAGDDVGGHAAATGFGARAGAREAEFLPDLRPQPGEIVIDKPTLSPWLETGLPAMLRERDVQYLILCGVLANGGIEQTAREAADRGFGVIVVADACAAETWTIHGFVMSTLVGGLIRTRTTQAVLEMLEGSRT